MAAVNHSNLPSSFGNSWSSELLQDSLDSDFPAEHCEPELNVKENGGFYEVEIGVPGLGNKDFYIKIENGTLTISAEKNSDKLPENYGTLKLSIAKPAEEPVEAN